MPLPAAAPRTRLHERRMAVDGYEREDGLYDLEGHLTDNKTYGFSSRFRGEVTPDIPVHEMWIRLTIDHTMRIHAVEAVTEFGPFPPCHDVAPNFQRLVGLHIGPGWNRAVRERLGGTQGCTHIVEMLAQVATTGYQTLVKRWEDERRRREAAGEPAPSGKRPPMLDTCYALASDGEIVRQLWPQFHKSAAGADG